jgi:signal transduction histidine kinase
MRPELAALVVHDLKNALGALEEELGVLAAHSETMAAQDSPALQEDAQRVRRSHMQCGELRQRFVQFLAVYGSGEHMRAHCSDESPIETLESLAATPPGNRPEVELALRLHENTPAFWYYDRRLVRMALDSALHNARRFATHRIEVSAYTEAGYLVFRMDDDGPGLSGDDPSADSTGLGTALCESVARAHSTTLRPGKVSLSNRPGGGARFELWLG